MFSGKSYSSKRKWSKLYCIGKDLSLKNVEEDEKLILNLVVTPFCLIKCGCTLNNFVCKCTLYITNNVAEVYIET